jgi:serine/threonine protein phosphatase PrpC
MVIYPYKGGRNAGEWFLERITESIRPIFTSPHVKPSNFDKLRSEIQSTLKRLDAEFCELRKQGYVKGEGEDDGCTLNLVILIDRLCISVHIGDSRTVISNGTDGVVHVTNDHSVCNLAKAAHIHANGNLV